MTRRADMTITLPCGCQTTPAPLRYPLGYCERHLPPDLRDAPHAPATTPPPWRARRQRHYRRADAPPIIYNEVRHIWHLSGACGDADCQDDRP